MSYAMNIYLIKMCIPPLYSLAAGLKSRTNPTIFKRLINEIKTTIVLIFYLSF